MGLPHPPLQALESEPKSILARLLPTLVPPLILRFGKAAAAHVLELQGDPVGPRKIPAS